MRILYLFIFSILCGSHVTAQRLDFDQVVRPADELTSFEDYLVYLAWLNHPVAGKLSNQAEIAAIEIKTEKLGYWETIMPFVNFSTGNNSGLSAPIVSPNPVEMPMTQSDGRSNAVSFGLSFRLLPLLTTKHRVDAAKENYDIAQLEIGEGKLLVRREVLAAYRSLLFIEKVVEERSTIEAAANENQRLILELFKQDGAEYEDVNSASNAYHKAVEERLRAELEAEKEKLNLEQWIGISLEEAMQRFAGVKLKRD